jgi:hypothetical protein
LRVRLAQTVAADEWMRLAVVAAAAPVGDDARCWRVRLREGATSDALARAIVERGWALEELRGESSALEETFMAIAASDARAIAA